MAETGDTQPPCQSQAGRGQERTERMKIHYKRHSPQQWLTDILCGCREASYFAVHIQGVTCKKCRAIIYDIPLKKVEALSPCQECGEIISHKAGCSINFTSD